MVIKYKDMLRVAVKCVTPIAHIPLLKGDDNLKHRI